MRCASLTKVAIAFVIAGACAPAGAAPPVTVITLGDSYIIGYGVNGAARFPKALAAALQASAVGAVVVDPPFQDTTSSGVEWLTKWDDGKDLLAHPANRAIMVELGGNDCINFLNLGQTEANLDQMLALLADKRIPVLVIGTRSYPACSKGKHEGYGEAYSKLFPALATKYGDLYYADFKDGIEDDPTLLQRDGDHPNEKGEAVVVAKILPSVIALIKQVAAE